MWLGGSISKNDRRYQQCQQDLVVGVVGVDILAKVMGEIDVPVTMQITVAAVAPMARIHEETIEIVGKVARVIEVIESGIETGRGTEIETGRGIEIVMIVEGTGSEVVAEAEVAVVIEIVETIPLEDDVMMRTILAIETGTETETGIITGTETAIGIGIGRGPWIPTNEVSIVLPPHRLHLVKRGVVILFVVVVAVMVVVVVVTVNCAIAVPPLPWANNLFAVVLVRAKVNGNSLNV